MISICLSDSSPTPGVVMRFCEIIYNLGARELATLSGLCTLDHLDLYLIGIRQIGETFHKPLV